jgi:Fe-S-cluster containining protein
MARTHTAERLEISIDTPAGPVTTPVEVPTGFVPVTEIVPLLRRLGEQALTLEQRRAEAAGQRISCRMGCAACCRMLVPISAPEAFALRDKILALPDAQRRARLDRVSAARGRLDQAGLLSRLRDIAETDRQLSDKDMEQTNREYYALRMPCPFLDNEVCSIYEDRPAACRELLVTSPAELCQDIARNPVRPVSVPVRMSTVLAMLWADLTGGPVRLIPLPLALEWAERHEAERKKTWKGCELLEKALEKVSRFLNQAGSR